jgi:Spy/CpxP family protein refolding chaperone
MTSIYWGSLVLVAVLSVPEGQIEQAVPEKLQSAQSHDGPQKKVPFKWWADDNIVSDLKLTAEQRQRISRAYDLWAPPQRTRWAELHEAEGALAQILAATPFDFSKSLHAIERVERLKFEVSRSRSFLLLTLYSELRPEQRLKLKDLGLSDVAKLSR